MVRKLTLNQAKNLKPGDILYHLQLLNADGTPMRWKVNGKPKVWKTRPNEVRVPLKRGLYTYGELTQHNLDQVSLTPPPDVQKSKIKGAAPGYYHR